MTRAIRVYVAGPYTKGDVAVNVREAILAGGRIYDAGMVPFVPHLTHFWHTVAPRPYEDWLRLDMEWLRVCDALLRLPGDSSGADKELLRRCGWGCRVLNITPICWRGRWVPPREVRLR